jgi:curli biogenesis system outer membrane secretion channel CsgG
MRICLVAVFVTLTAAAVFGQSNDTGVDVAGELATARELYMNADFEKSLALTQKLLNEPSINSYDSVAIYEMQGLIYFSMGADYRDRARECLKRISSIGPCLVPFPRDYWPRGFCTSWYDVARPAGAMPCPFADTGETEIRTIAVYDFDNNSVAEYMDKLGNLGAGLATFFQHDFSKISTLQMVERDKIAYIIKEDSLAMSGLVDQQTAVKAGRILGVHIMVFGDFTQIDHNNTSVAVRAVKVETGEIIASAVAQGRPDYFKLEKQLVKDLCDILNVKLSKQDTESIESGGSSSMDATTAYATGLHYEDIYDYKQAYHYFSKAVELDPKFEEAKLKMSVYKPLVS